MSKLNLCIAAVLLLMTTGCVSVEVGAKSEPSRLELEGLGTAYAAATGVRPYDGKFLKAHLLSGHGDKGELASLEIWPICGVGIGLVGARVNVTPVEVGAGVLFYDPEPENYIKRPECKEKDKEGCKGANDKN